MVSMDNIFSQSMISSEKAESKMETKRRKRMQLNTLEIIGRRRNSSEDVHCTTSLTEENKKITLFIPTVRGVSRAAEPPPPTDTYQY